MRVVRPATKYREFEHTCKSCDAVLMVEQKDIQYKPASGDQRDYEPAYYYATCAECRTQFTVPPDKVPAILAVSLRNQRPARDIRD